MNARSSNLDVSEAGEGDLSVEVSNGRRNLPIQTISNGNGYTIRILAKSVGVYNVYINWNGKFISDNPLKLIVHDRGKVYVYGDGIDKALVGHPASFIVDSRAYGDGVLKAKVKGPTSRAKTSKAENPDGTHTVMYVPLEAGLHTISVFLSEKEIPGSPFVAEVKEKKVKQPSAVFAVSTRNYEPPHASNSVVSTRVNHNVHAISDENAILVFGDGLTSVLEGQIAGFVIDPRNASAGGDLTIQITGPNSFAKCNVQQNQDGTLTATYVPGEVGPFTIDISWSGKRIKGSPFLAEASNPSKISLCGKQQNNGNIRFEVGRPNVIEFDTSGAGKGVLTSFIDGPVGQHMNVMIERGLRSSIITYNPPVEGEYKLHILWSGNPIPNSPFYIISENRRSQIDLTRIHVTNLIADMVVNGTYEFVIDGSAVEYGVPSAYMQGFSENIPIQIVSQHGNVYTATFTPKHTGAYLLHIKWSGHEIPGSPFSINVNEMKTQFVEDATINGFQRSMGTKLPNTLRTGKAYSLTIDANEVGGAKVGEMAVTCDGPTSSVPVQLRDNFNNTFDIMLTPSEIGSHLLNIKVNGTNIEGSPFSFDVSGAHQVSCYGQGLVGGPLATYDSSFQCDTRTAGAGQLKIRAHGPKGAFNVEILPTLKNRRMLNVKFHPSTKGVYTLNVQWNDEHVPGSPFKIKLT
ncbi:filamin-B-like [Anneissia japonica]|uniref:filamin-B-like n=1 Tax=Anneissia japonica TaxID=1529436 RepID=UPI0014257CE7|nr:filamin-B-like [Anneissia japonica]